MKVYLITDDSREWGDFYNPCGAVIFVTTDKNKALSTFNNYREFCEETLGDEKWFYGFNLYEGENEEISLINKCDNIKE